VLGPGMAGGRRHGRRDRSCRVRATTDRINRFERELVDDGVVIVKVMLHISNGSPTPPSTGGLLQLPSRGSTAAYGPAGLDDNSAPALGPGRCQRLLCQVARLRLGDVTQVPIVPRLLSGLSVVQSTTQIVTDIHDRRVQVLLA